MLTKNYGGKTQYLLTPKPSLPINTWGEYSISYHFLNRKNN